MASGKEFVESDEVAERFSHLLAIDGNHVVVHPVAYGIVAVVSHRLRYFAFVVREFQVHAAAMNVEGLAQIFFAHG